MTTLLAVIFVIELVVQLVNAIGGPTINNLLWRVVTSFPTQLSKDFADQQKLQKEYLDVRRELNATSSQDEFAKWAKLRRNHDKLLEQLEKKKKALDGTRSWFDRYLTVARWVLTRIPQWVLPLWYIRTPMFWLPYGWFPGQVEKIMAFPWAPLGSVSAFSWQMACTGVIALIGETITAILGLVASTRQKKATPVAAGNGAQEKKDL